MRGEKIDLTRVKEVTFVVIDPVFDFLDTKVRIKLSDYISVERTDEIYICGKGSLLFGLW